MPITANLPLKQPMPVNTKAVYFFEVLCKPHAKNRSPIIFQVKYHQLSQHMDNTF